MTAPVVEVYREFRFEAAHRLPNVPEGHKDARLHGHSYRVVLRLRGPVDPVSGYVCDFGVLKSVFREIERHLDHRTLNDVVGLENPTCEAISVWIWSRTKTVLPWLCAVEVHESPWSGCTYSGQEDMGGK